MVDCYGKLAQDGTPSCLAGGLSREPMPGLQLMEWDITVPDAWGLGSVLSVSLFNRSFYPDVRPNGHHLGADNY